MTNDGNRRCQAGFLVATYLASLDAMKWIEIIMIVAIVSLSVSQIECCMLILILQGLYPTLAVALVVNHKTPIADQLTSIESIDGEDAELASDGKWEGR